MVTLNYFENSDWDFLIVLDACRFDFFSHFYKQFFTGTLNKITSPGSCTTEWFTNSFKDRSEDVVYISANPYINSIHTTSGFDFKKNFFKLDAKNHFYKVIDVWNFGWNDKLDTVHPEILSRVALSLREQCPNKRFIIHYMQPHAPYISEKFFFRELQPNVYNVGNLWHRTQILSDLTHEFNPKLTVLFRNISFLVNKAFSFLGNIYTIKINNFLGLPSITPMDAILIMHGIDGLRKAYAENLKIVLGHVALLVSKLSGNIIITSDHGEFLGEKRRVGHPCGNYDPIVRSITWFKITSVKRHLKYRDISDIEYSI